MNKKQEIILNKDIINQCLDYLVGSKEYHKKNYDKVIHQMGIIFKVYEGNNIACSKVLLKIIDVDEDIPNLVSYGQHNDFEIFLPFFKKYFGKPWKYALETQKKKELCLWT